MKVYSKAMNNPTDTTGLMRALQFAAHKHRHQRRKNSAKSPYINHPIAVAHALSIDGGVVEISVLMAALLHDTLEDTDTTLIELHEQFGADIAAIVREVSDDKSLPKAERKRLQILHAPQLSRPAQLIKLADKLCNLRDVVDDPPHHWDAQRRIEYMEWTAAVVNGLRGANAQLEAAYDDTLIFARRALHSLA